MYKPFQFGVQDSYIGGSEIYEQLPVPLRDSQDDHVALDAEECIVRQPCMPLEEKSKPQRALTAGDLEKAVMDVTLG